MIGRCETLLLKLAGKMQFLQSCIIGHDSITLSQRAGSVCLALSLFLLGQCGSDNQVSS